LSWHLADLTPRRRVRDRRHQVRRRRFPTRSTTTCEWFIAAILYRPGTFSPYSDDFVAYVKANGWPEVDDLRGKFVFCLSGNADWKSYYAQTNPRARLCFADKDFDDGKTVTVPTTGQQIIYLSNLYSSNFDIWKNSIASLRAANLITRGYVLNGEDLWNKAKDAKLNAFATDKITGHSWAYVGSTPFVQL
jgi:hypothetical protein